MGKGKKQREGEGGELFFCPMIPFLFLFLRGGGGKMYHISERKGRKNKREEKRKGKELFF